MTGPKTAGVLLFDTKKYQSGRVLIMFSPSHDVSVESIEMECLQIISRYEHNFIRVVEHFTLASQQDSHDPSHEINDGILRTLRKEMSSGKFPLQGMQYKVNNAILYMKIVHLNSKATNKNTVILCRQSGKRTSV